jgi:hypothetical protein
MKKTESMLGANLPISYKHFKKESRALSSLAREVGADVIKSQGMNHAQAWKASFQCNPSFKATNDTAPGMMCLMNNNMMQIPLNPLLKLTKEFLQRAKWMPTNKHCQM